jgi:hypothetical protein
MEGYVPSHLTISIDESEDHRKVWGNWAENDERFAYVDIEPSDRRFDLRFTHGMRCFVQGPDRARLAQVVGACIACGAAHVSGWLLDPSGSKVIEMPHLFGQWACSCDSQNGVKHG